VEVNDQLHASVGLLPGREILVPTG
jgi:hypothetical protein